MAREVRTHSSVYHDYFEFAESIKWKQSSKNTCLRMVGVMEVNVATIPSEWLDKILTAVRKGYRTAQSGPAMKLLNLLSLYNPIRPMAIGYVGRNTFGGIFPKLAPVHEYIDELNCLFSLERGRNVKVFRPLTSNKLDRMDQTCVYAKIARDGPTGKGHAPTAKLTRARRVLEAQLMKHSEFRDPLLDWLLTKPVLRIPYASHDKDWKWR